MDFEFKTFRELAQHATALTLEVEGALHTMLVVATDELLRQTRKTFGEYQDGFGVYPEWPELAKATKEDRVARGFTENDPLLRSGALRDSYYAEVQGLEGGVGSELPQALGMEVGDPRKNVPARSTLGLTFARAEDKTFKRSGETLAAVILYGRGRTRRRINTEAL